MEWSGVEFANDGQSASTSWCWAALWGPWPDVTCSLVWYVFLSSFIAPSLTRGRVCILQCTSTHWSESPRTHNYILLSHLNLGSLFVTSYVSQVYGAGILTRLHTGPASVGSGVWPKMSSGRLQRNHRLSLLKCDCWFVTAGTRIREESRIRGRGELPLKCAFVWLLRNTSQYCIHNCRTSHWGKNSVQ
jgi:hypothetical protein